MSLVPKKCEVCEELFWPDSRTDKYQTLVCQNCLDGIVEALLESRLTTKDGRVVIDLERKGRKED